MKKPATISLFAFTFLLGLALPFLPTLTDGEEYYGLAVDNSVPPLKLLNPHIDQGLRVVFFGYRACGTLCPVQILNLVELQKRLRDLPVEFVFITLDPERDTEQALLQAAQAFGPGFTAVRPETALHAQQLALSYGDVAARVQNSTGYDFDHSAGLMVVTTDWQRRLVYPQSILDIDKVESDLRRLAKTI